MSKVSVKSKGFKMLVTVLAVVAALLLLFLMPFMKGARKWAAEKMGKPLEVVEDFSKALLLTSCAVLVGVVAVIVGAALPIVAVCMVAIAVAIVVYAWWPMLFVDDEDPEPTTIGDETNN